MLTENLWIDPDDTERDVIAKTIESDCKRSLAMFAFIAVIVILGVVVGFYEMLFGEERDHSVIFIAIVGIPMLAVFGAGNLKLVGYIKKVRQGMFKLRRVELTNKETGNSDGTHFYLTVTPIDEPEESAVVEVERGLYDKVRIGLIGRFVRIDDEKLGKLVSPYWFIADSDLGLSPDGNAAATVVPLEGSFAEPDEDIHQAMLSGYKKDNRMVYVRSVICAVLFLIGGVLIGAGSFPEDISRYLSLYYSLTGMAVCVIPIVILTRQHTKRVHERKKGALLIWGLWLNLNMLGVFFVCFDVVQLVFRIILLAALFIMNIANIYIAQADFFFTVRELKAHRYTVASVTVMNMDQETKVYFVPDFRTCYMLVVRSPSDQTFEVEVSRKQYSATNIGNPGMLAVLNKRPGIRVFSGR